MGRYVQQISLVPFSTAEIWVGWELEGVEGEIEGLVAAVSMSPADLDKLSVREFQFIPAVYASEIQLEIRKKDPGADRGIESGKNGVTGARGTDVGRSSQREKSG